MSNQIAFTAPHHQATAAGMAILEKGGSAIEAMVAAAAAVAVAYPHMNSLGGDGFWLIHEPRQEPMGIDGCGRSALGATPEFYQGLEALPERGGGAALTMAGTISGWQLALERSNEWQPALPLEQLLAPAITLAEEGIAVTDSLVAASRKTWAALKDDRHFAELFLDDGQPLTAGRLLRNPRLGRLLRRLADDGLESFYRGEVAERIAVSLAEQGSPLSLADFHRHQPRQVTPLSVPIAGGSLYNLPLPTQGIASLLILALFDRLYRPAMTPAEQVHLLVECTKQAFIVRDRLVTDPERAPGDPAEWLTEASLEKLAAGVSLEKAAPWPPLARPGDTVWMGARDAKGRTVSFIQSIYWEFGSGVVIPEMGLVWNNRGVSFSLEEGALNRLQPATRPFHTLNPALALLDDGRRIAYGTMGGEGQPQTQAALLHRYLHQQLPLAEAIAKPRWLLGRTWGESTFNLKLEADLDEAIQSHLADRGHDLQVVAPCNEMMGHAGAVVSHADGRIEAGTDPRSDGAALVG